jgi:hypothetical protein
MMMKMKIIHFNSLFIYGLKLVLTSPTSGGRSVGIVRWRTKAPEFVYFVFIYVLSSTDNDQLQSEHEYK